jgi:hypothetical protein
MTVVDCAGVVVDAQYGEILGVHIIALEENFGCGMFGAYE